MVGSVLVASSEVFAQTISWQPYSAVPMDTASLVILALLFMVGGTWILFKSRKHAVSFLGLAAILVSVYNISAIAKALPFQITTPSGNNEPLGSCNRVIENAYSQSVVITFINTSDCPPVNNTCIIGAEFKPGDTCSISTDQEE